MRVPRPLTIATLTFTFPILVSVAWIFKFATLGEALISFQLAVLTFQTQKYFWTEADYHEVKHFLFGRK